MYEFNRRRVGASHNLTAFEQLQRIGETADRQARTHQTQALDRQIHGVSEEWR